MKNIAFLFSLFLVLVTSCNGGKTSKSETGQEKTETADVIETASVEFGLIPNTGGDWYNNNPKECLAFVAEMGYSYLESVGALPGFDLEESREYVKSLGLKTVVMPTSTQSITEAGDALLKDIQVAKECGADYLVCYNWPIEENMEVASQWYSWAERMNKAGKICKENGVTLIYHNHDKEFKPVENQLPFDIFMEKMDPDFVKLELDVYWATKGGADPIEILKKYPEYVAALHLKDMNRETGDFEDVGYGSLDIVQIIKESKNTAVKYLIVEHDKPDNPKESIRRSGTYLRDLKL